MSVPPPPPVIVPQFDDTWFAERLVALFGYRFRYVLEWGEWMVYSEGVWRRDSRGCAILSESKRVGLELRARAADPSLPDDLRTALRKAAKTASSGRARKTMIELAKAEEGVLVSVDQLDPDPWLLNCENGVLDLRTLTLLDHDPAYLMTRITATSYDPNASCPRFERFLLEAMGGDHELVAYLQRASGYSTTGDVSRHVLFFLSGDGGNGKGTFTRALLDVLGDYGGTGAPYLAQEKRGGDEHPAQLADLLGRRFVAVQETRENGAWAEARLKTLSGGDTIKARGMGKDWMEFEPTHKLWLSGNHLPPVSGTDHGFWRRMRVIPFYVCPARPDPQLGEALRAELPGILAWVVRGLDAFKHRGLDEPRAVLAATEAYRTEEDHFARFISERCVLTPEAQVARSALVSSYSIWANLNGEKTMDARGIAGRARGLSGVEEGMSNGERLWRGVGLR